MPSESEFRSLILAEQQFVESASLIGQKVCAHYLPSVTLRLPDSLDDAYGAWASDTGTKKPAPNDVCFGLGALLGNCVVSELGFSWGMATDQFGVEYCVHHPDAWQSFPFDFVAKRIEDQEPQGGFFRALYNLLRERRPV